MNLDRQIWKDLHGTHHFLWSKYSLLYVLRSYNKFPSFWVFWTANETAVLIVRLMSSVILCLSEDLFNYSVGTQPVVNWNILVSWFSLAQSSLWLQLSPLSSVNLLFGRNRSEQIRWRVPFLGAAALACFYVFLRQCLCRQYICLSTFAYKSTR